MKALGAHATRALKRRGQDVLPGVLLHVVEPPRPVDDAGDGLSRLQWSRHHVSDDVVIAIHNLKHGVAAEGTRVEGLTAGRGIKRCPVERDV